MSFILFAHVREARVETSEGAWHLKGAIFTAASS